MPDSPTIIEVAIPLPLESSFHYLVPPRLVSQVKVGKRVLAPFGRRKLTGYIIGKADSAEGELKEIIDLLDREPLFTVKELEFLRWTASYYLHPLGEVLKAALPAGINVESRLRPALTPNSPVNSEEVLTGGKQVKTDVFYALCPAHGAERELKGKRAAIVEFIRAAGEVAGAVLRRDCGADAALLRDLRERGYINAQVREVYRDPFREEVFESDSPFCLNDDQKAALDRIALAAEQGRFAPFLLHGVTGSGKTEVYLQAIARVMAAGKTALVLVPEIALTPQLVRRFKRRFTCGVAVLHSALTDGERFDEWRRIRRGEAEIVIGARSAIFAPLQRIGIIVVDEEHDPSYKQSEGLRYNSRDLALVRGKMESACVVLGSATPLVTSFHGAQDGKLGYLHLPRRVRDLPMPAVELLDGRGRKGETFLPPMSVALQQNLACEGQSLLFINRRGFATFLICSECGHVLHCPNCSVTLTFHRLKGRHFCHYCDYSIPAPSVCPSCQSPAITPLGRGTERVEEEVKALLPQARVGRMDRDTTRGRGGHARILRRMEEGRIDILIGTQMIAKGHDIPGVTLVGVVSADATLNLPDFRAAERTFQLITQVMGRAGRGDAPGRVLVQSLTPDHYAVARAAAHDYAGFYAEELEYRREAAYPPFSRLAALIFSGNNEKEVEKGAETAARLLRETRSELRGRVEILGPAAAPLVKVRGRFRWQILLKAPGRTDLHRLLAAFKRKTGTTRRSPLLPATVRLAIDVDPVELL
ncbi:MAG TPA: primosomal protein N' [Geobacteraceae bacterium]|nr:primosomal protein N' [Geobacteraceae bacterium]